MNKKILDMVNVEDIPENYTWSGYCKSIAEFKEANFFSCCIDKKEYYICSMANGVGLCDYLSNYIFKLEQIKDVEAVLSPGYDYWFLQAWEMAAPEYDELADWCKNIVELLVEKELLEYIEIQGEYYFLFSDLENLRIGDFQESIINPVIELCKQGLLEYFADKLEEYGNVEDITVEDAGEWASSVLNIFKQKLNTEECTY